MATKKTTPNVNPTPFAYGKTEKPQNTHIWRDIADFLVSDFVTGTKNLISPFANDVKAINRLSSTSHPVGGESQLSGRLGALEPPNKAFSTESAVTPKPKKSKGKKTTGETTTGGKTGTTKTPKKSLSKKTNKFPPPTYTEQLLYHLLLRPVNEVKKTLQPTGTLGRLLAGETPQTGEKANAEISTMAQKYATEHGFGAAERTLQSHVSQIQSEMTGPLNEALARQREAERAGIETNLTNQENLAKVEATSYGNAPLKGAITIGKQHVKAGNIYGTARPATFTPQQLAYMKSYMQTPSLKSLLGSLTTSQQKMQPIITTAAGKAGITTATNYSFVPQFKPAASAATPVSTQSAYNSGS